ncbi:hypothetical protein I4U23_023209 [Adineta vaga]|nr:hypothetical protein I4U23_023209 [Adineta vaga]
MGIFLFRKNFAITIAFDLSSTYRLSFDTLQTYVYTHNRLFKIIFGIFSKQGSTQQNPVDSSTQILCYSQNLNQMSHDQQIINTEKGSLKDPILNMDISLTRMTSINVLSPNTSTKSATTESSTDLLIDSLSCDSNSFEENELFTSLDDFVLTNEELHDSSVTSNIPNSFEKLSSSHVDIFDNQCHSILIQNYETVTSSITNDTIIVSTDSTSNDSGLNSDSSLQWTRFGNKKVIKYSEEYHHRRLKNNRAVKRTREKDKEDKKLKALKMTMLINENQQLITRVDQLTNELATLKSSCEALVHTRSINTI